MLRFMLLFSILSWASISHAEEGPSYDETVQFLQEKMEYVANDRKWEVEFPQRCVIETTQSLLDYSGSSGLFRSRSTVNLRDLNPSTAHYDDRFVEVFVREMRDLTTNQMTRYFRDIGKFREYVEWAGDCVPVKKMTCQEPPVKTDRFFIRPRPPRDENGPRVTRAFSHLIKLCGGRDELF